MIAVVGSLNMDLIARVAHLPVPGETVSASEYTRTLGGKGANQAVAAALAGATVQFVGRAGIDAAGNESVAGLESAGVSTRHVARDSTGSTGTALVAVDARGENTIVIVPGVNANLQREDIDRAKGAIAESDFLLLQLEVPLETVIYAAETARAHGRTVVLNPSPAQALPPSLLKLVDVLVPNEAEVAYLTGMGAPLDPASAAGLLRGAGVGSVVVTMGERGAVVIDAHGETDIPAHDVAPQDTTGAGDAFAGNLVAAMDRGMTLVDAAAFASAAAALSVQCSGAQPSMPTRAETERLVAESHSA